MFLAKPNPISGICEWIIENSYYEFNCEIANSQYSDMLHDQDRNTKFFWALKEAINYLKKNGCEINVLDIGTGTGLLAMIAKLLEADSVIGYEAFSPMAECAEKIIRQNGFHNITIYKNNSKVFYRGNSEKTNCIARPYPNLLVSEILDSELLGEGIISTFNHANSHLFKNEEGIKVVIPSKGIIYGQILDSQKLRRYNKIQFPYKFKIPYGAFVCAGPLCPFGIQASRLKENLDFRVMSDPIKLFELDFTQIMPSNQTRTITIPCQDDGRCDCLLVWWSLDMLPSWMPAMQDYGTTDDLTLTTAPSWISSQNYHWRDHWMQTVYFFSQPIPHDPVLAKRGQRLTLRCTRDEYSLWFSLSTRQPNETQLPDDNGDVTFPQRPMCSCHFHSVLSRPRISYINDPDSPLPRLIRYLSRSIPPNGTVIFISDFSIIPFELCRIYPQLQVYVLSPNQTPSSIKVFEDMIRANDIRTRIKVVQKYGHDLTLEDLDHCARIDAIIGEPYFVTTDLPWHNLRFFYQLNQLCTNPDFKGFLRDGHAPFIFPSYAKLKGIAVNYPDLWKVRAPLTTLTIKEGPSSYRPSQRPTDLVTFDMSAYNDLISSSTIVLEHGEGVTHSVPSQKQLKEYNEARNIVIESRYLWEYECLQLSLEPFDVFTFDPATWPSLYTGGGVMETLVVLKLRGADDKYLFNGFAFWMDFGSLSHSPTGAQDLTSDQDLTFYVDNGPESPDVSQNYSVGWRQRDIKQGVALAYPPWEILPNERDKKITIKIRLDLKTGKLSMTEAVA